ncbi:hypothetical protein AZF01_08170 [Martelella sp. AD-3]|nr:hypothetical protein AZF01_08170 [Martelella sp. AD-3]MAM10755.1 hypothetical protein [Rhizobiaceae bacterium]
MSVAVIVIFRFDGLKVFAFLPGIKKGPFKEPVVAHGWLMPDGYTILPMRDPTTIRSSFIAMLAD